MSARSSSSAVTPIPLFPRAQAGPALHALLISEDPGWIVPVREAVAAAGGVVETVTARAAIARLSGPCAGVSHVLVDRKGAGALAEIFIDLTTDTASPDIVLLLLDPNGPEPDGPRTILTPSRRSVAAPGPCAKTSPGPSVEGAVTAGATYSSAAFAGGAASIASSAFAAASSRSASWEKESATMASRASP